MRTNTRGGGRPPGQLRPWKITSGILRHAEGSALIEAGLTQVICSASVEDKVPAFLKDQGKGWITAEYSMLPRSTHTRSPRERGTRVGGRTMEIQRFIGRSLRSVTDLALLGERTITLDCDVIQADGGTRVAAVTAAWVALYEALKSLRAGGKAILNPPLNSVAAVSVGMVNDELLLDLDYEEDSMADVDMNVVMTGGGRLVEVQATAEGAPFLQSRLNAMIRLARSGIRQIMKIQQEAINRKKTA